MTTGAEMRQSMSIAIFGGLLTSTLLTLLVIPVVYLIFDDLQDKFTGALKALHSKYGHYLGEDA